MLIQAQKNGRLEQAEQLELARLLIKAGYSVRIARVKKSDTSTVLVNAVEYWSGNSPSDR